VITIKLRRSKMTEEVDIYIKDEGHKSIRFLSDEAKLWAYGEGIENDLGIYEDGGFCGEEVWTSKKQSGMYRAGLKMSKSSHRKFLKDIRNSELSVESEFE